MSVPKYRLDAIETIGRKILQEYDPALLDGPPQAVPIETIIETKFDLTLEYHCLRKNGSILGETLFDEGAAILYDQDEKRYAQTTFMPLRFSTVSLKNSPVEKAMKAKAISDKKSVNSAFSFSR